MRCRGPAPSHRRGTSPPFAVGYEVVVEGFHDGFVPLDALDSVEIEYAAIGGLSLPAYGHDRTTRDVDLTVGVSLEECPRLRELLESRGLHVHERPFPVGPFLSHRAIVLEGPGFEVDLLLCTNEFQRDVLMRKQTHQVFGRRVWVASLEHVLVYKLLTRRLQDALDWLRLFELNPSADLVRVREWTKAFQMEDRLDALLRRDLSGWEA